MQAFISNLTADDTISYSELSEPLIVYTTGKIQHTVLDVLYQLSFHIFLYLIF